MAEKYGFFAGTLWDHPSNAALRARRKYMNVLAPGDVLAIPDLETKTVECSTGHVHTFRRRGIPALLRLRFLRDDKPRANVPYRLVVGGAEQRGLTDAEGVLEAFVAPGAREGALILDDDEDEVVALRFGELDPIDSVTGIQARLQNLGFPCDTTGELDAPTRAALSLFQSTFDLERTGEPDDATQAKLFALHDDHAPA